MQIGIWRLWLINFSRTKTSNTELSMLIKKFIMLQNLALYLHHYDKLCILFLRDSYFNTNSLIYKHFTICSIITLRRKLLLFRLRFSYIVACMVVGYKSFIHFYISILSNYNDIFFYPFFFIYYKKLKCTLNVCD